MMQSMAHNGKTSRLRDTQIIIRSNALATIGALASVTMWLTDIRQIGSPAAVAPGLALCCGLFGMVFSVWVTIRDSRPLYSLFSLWALIPLLWTIYFLLIIHPASPQL